MLMAQIDAQDMEWYAVRIRREGAGAVRKIVVGGEFETCRDRQGRIRKRRKAGTGKTVFLPEHLLRRAGFEVFLPVRKVLRRRTRFSPEKHLVSQPLLVDWLFVGWPAGHSRWHELMALEVVSGVMGTGGRPVRIASDRVMRLMRQWGGGMLSPGCSAFLKTGCAVSVGDTARVTSGPLAGSTVRVVDIRNSSARATLDFLGGETAVEISADILAPINSSDVKRDDEL